MGAANSKPAPAPAVIDDQLDEKRSLVAARKPVDKPDVEVDSSLSHDNISQWTKALDEVSTPLSCYAFHFHN